MITKGLAILALLSVAIVVESKGPRHIRMDDGHVIINVGTERQERFSHKDCPICNPDGKRGEDRERRSSGLSWAPNKENVLAQQ